MERNYLIAMLLGKYFALGHITSDDLRHQVDLDLLDGKMKPLGQEDGDLILLDELLGEVMIHVMGRGINRKQRRQK